MDYDAVFTALALGDIDRADSSWHAVTAPVAQLDPRAEAVVGLGALIALGASEPSLTVVVDRALGAGVTPDEIAAILVALAPIVGSARLIQAAPAIGLGLGIDVDTLLERR